MATSLKAKILVLIVVISISCSQDLKLFNDDVRVTTGPVSDITATSARCTGAIAEGLYRVEGTGVCWSISSNPTIADSRLYYGTRNSSFTHTVTNLTPNTIYYIRAYVALSGGSTYVYGSIISFKTLSN